MRDRWKFLTQYANSPTHPERTSNLCARWLWCIVSGARLSADWFVRGSDFDKSRDTDYTDGLGWEISTRSFLAAATRARRCVAASEQRAERMCFCGDETTVCHHWSAACSFVHSRQRIQQQDFPKKLFWKALAASRLLFILGRLSKRGIPISKSLT